MRNKRAFAAALLLTLALLWRFSSRRVEDFAYYWCTAQVSTYEVAPFAACLQSALGRPLPAGYESFGSAHSPFVAAVFGLLKPLGYNGAFWAWNLVLLLAAAAALWKVKDPLLLALWPGFILSLAYHKWTLVIFAAFLWGGGALALAAANVQWAVALSAVAFARRRWKEAAVAVIGLSVGMAWLGSPEAVARWFENVRRHSGVLTRDNQSLFMLLYPGGLSFGVAETLRYCLGALLGAAALYVSRRSVEWALVLVVLALPYSHASESIWAFPLLAAALDKKSIWGLGACAYFAFLFKFYPPGNLSEPFHQNIQAWLTVAVAVLAASRRTLIR
jgi:hypothetical protein